MRRAEIDALSATIALATTSHGQMRRFGPLCHVYHRTDPVLVPWHPEWALDLRQCSGPPRTQLIHKCIYIYIYIYMYTHIYIYAGKKLVRLDLPNQVPNLAPEHIGFHACLCIYVQSVVCVMFSL